MTHFRPPLLPFQGEGWGEGETPRLIHRRSPVTAMQSSRVEPPEISTLHPHPSPLPEREREQKRSLIPASFLLMLCITCGATFAAEPLTTKPNSIGMNFVLIPPGTFQRGMTDEHKLRINHPNTILLGADLQDERPAHPVQISRPFWIGGSRHRETVRRVCRCDALSNRRRKIRPRRHGVSCSAQGGSRSLHTRSEMQLAKSGLSADRRSSGRVRKLA